MSTSLANGNISTHDTELTQKILEWRKEVQDNKRFQIKWDAVNEHTPKEYLHELSKSVNHSILRSVANNTSTSPETLTEMFYNTIQVDEKNKTSLLSTHTHNIQLALAGNSSTPEPILTQLSQSGNRNIRMNVAYNPNTPSEILQTLSKDDDWDVIVWAMKNSTMPVHVLEEFYTFPAHRIRSGVAENIKCPEKILHLLSEDEEPYVRLCAVNTLLNKGHYSDWPDEWIEERFGIKLVN